MNTQEQNDRPEDETPQTPETEAAQAETQAAEQPEPQTEDAGKELADKLAAAEAKADEYLALVKRVQADFDNFRRRNESVRADSFEDGKRSTATLMLPVIDNLERAVDAAANTGDSPLKSGVELTLRQLRDVFTKLNITAIDRAGQPFDPHQENAVLQGTADDGEPGTVCQVLQKGYMMGEKVLRPAMVKVVPED